MLDVNEFLLMNKVSFCFFRILINNQGAEVLRQHFLTKICQFLFIVDKAWRDNTISRKNRCLFVEWSAYKVGIFFSKFLMRSVHKQIYEHHS